MPSSTPDNSAKLASADQQMLTISYPRILTLAVPVILANLAMPLQSLIDTAVVGHFDTVAALAGLGLSVQLLALLLVSFNFLQYASSGLAAQTVGSMTCSQQRLAQLKAILQRAVLLAVLIGMVLMLCQRWLIDLGLTLLSANTASRLAAEQYLQMRFWGIIAELMNYAFLGWFAGQGKTKLMLYQQSVIAISNILLTLSLVYLWDMGLVGVALGTVIAYWLGMVLAVVMSSRQLQIQLLELFQIQAGTLAKHKMLRLFSLNKDILIRTLVLTISFAWITRLSAQSGDLVLAANAILLQVLTLSAFALDGVAVATESLTGQLKGYLTSRSPSASSTQSKQSDMAQPHTSELSTDTGFALLLRRTGTVSYALAILLSLLWAVAMPLYLSGMTSITAVFDLAYAYRWYAIGLPIVGVGAYWLDGVLFGLTAGRVIRQAALWVAGVFFPVSWLLYHYLGLHGIWLSVYCLLLLRLFVIAAFLRWHSLLTVTIDC